MVQHVCNAASIVIAVCNIQSSPPLNHLQQCSSKFGRTSEIYMYTAMFTSWMFIQRFLQRNPRVLSLQPCQYRVSMSCHVRSQHQGILLTLHSWVYDLWGSSWTWFRDLFLCTWRTMLFWGWGDIPHNFSHYNSFWRSSRRIWQSFSDSISLYTT